MIFSTLSHRNSPRYVVLVCLVLAASQLLAGCASPPPVARADTQRDTAPGAPQADIDWVVTEHQAFAFALYHGLSGSEGNIVASPYSISMALTMVYGGARNATADQMSHALRNNLPQERLHPALNALDQTLIGRAAGSDPARPNFQLNIANAVWGEKDYAFKPDYLDLLARSYGAGIQLADFKGSPEPSREVINQWVSGQTKDKIKDLFAPGSIDGQTRLVLVNAIYFLGKWANEFDPDITHDGEFTLLDGSKAQVPMMENPKIVARYVAGEGYQAVSLPYQGGPDTLAMLIILPDNGHFADFEKRLDERVYSEVMLGLVQRPVKLTMPRFKIESSFGLADQLSALGMPDAFDPEKADFTGMATFDPSENLYISSVVHKAFINVSEEGTEAAAATGAVMSVTSAQLDETPEMRIDHPFLFAIYDQGTGEILFLGRVLDPTQ